MTTPHDNSQLTSPPSNARPPSASGRAPFSLVLALLMCAACTAPGADMRGTSLAVQPALIVTEDDLVWKGNVCSVEGATMWLERAGQMSFNQAATDTAYLYGQGEIWFGISDKRNGNYFCRPFHLTPTWTKREIPSYIRDTDGDGFYYLVWGQSPQAVCSLGLEVE